MGMTIDIDPEEVFDQWCDSIGRRGGPSRMEVSVLGDQCYKLLNTARDYDEMGGAIMHMLKQSEVLLENVTAKIKELAEGCEQ